MRWAAVLAISLASQAAIAQPQAGFPRKAALTPEQTITRFQAAGDSGLEAFWKLLGLPPGGDVANCRSDCKADQIPIYRLRRSTPDQIVRLIFGYGRLGARVLYFRDDRILGFIDDIGDNYSEPDVTPGFDGNFQLLSHPRGGTGVHVTWRSWYHVSDKGIQLEVSALEEGAEYEAQGVTRLFWAKRLPTPGLDEHYAVFLYYLGVWSSDGGDGWILFDDTRRVVFSRKNLNEPMKFDRVGSDITADDLAKVYHYDTLTSEHFVRFSLKHLLSIARGSDARKKE